MNYLFDINNLVDKEFNFNSNLEKINKGDKFSEYKGIKFSERAFKEIKSKNPEVDIEIRNVDEEFIDSYYEKIQDDCFKKDFISKIIISSDVKKKMEKDNNYAYKILAAILSTGITRGVDDLKRKLYEFNIFVKNNGELEVITCMDADYKKMQKEKRKLDQREAARKENIKKKIKQVKSVIYSRYRYANNKYNLLNRCSRKKSYIPYSYFLSQNSELKRLQFDLNS